MRGRRRREGEGHGRKGMEGKGCKMRGKEREL